MSIRARSSALALCVAVVAACSGTKPAPRPAPVVHAQRREAAHAVPPTTMPEAGPLTTALDAVLVNTNSCLVVSDGSKVVYSHEANVALTPASTQKLLVAAAALDALGPSYRFTTAVVAQHAPVAGVVGALWLVGGGDPLLASPQYAALLQTSPVTAGYPTTPVDALAGQLVAHGVRVVLGGVHGDDSRYSRQRSLPTWAPSINRGEFDVGPLGALEVDEGLDSWHPVAVATKDPAGHAAGVLARLLTSRGVVTVQASDQDAPGGGVVLASVQSAPLSAIVQAMLRASDNEIAELLVRELDRHAGGSGTTAGGVAQVMQDVAQLGIPTRGLSLVDGSGLSDADHVTCPTLLAALDLGDQARYSAISEGLSVAGVNGSLAGVFVGTPLAGRLAAKGGYIDGVTALVGRIGGRRFAFVANGNLPFAVGLGLSERVASAVAS